MYIVDPFEPSNPFGPNDCNSLKEWLQLIRAVLLSVDIRLGQLTGFPDPPSSDLRDWLLEIEQILTPHESPESNSSANVKATLFRLDFAFLSASRRVKVFVVPRLLLFAAIPDQLRREAFAFLVTARRNSEMIPSRVQSVLSLLDQAHEAINTSTSAAEETVEVLFDLLTVVAAATSRRIILESLSEGEYLDLLKVLELSSSELGFSFPSTAFLTRATGALSVEVS